MIQNNIVGDRIHCGNIVGDRMTKRKARETKNGQRGETGICKRGVELAEKG